MQSAETDTAGNVVHVYAFRACRRRFVHGRRLPVYGRRRFGTGRGRLFAERRKSFARRFGLHVVAVIIFFLVLFGGARRIREDLFRTVGISYVALRPVGIKFRIRRSLRLCGFCFRGPRFRRLRFRLRGFGRRLARARPFMPFRIGSRAAEALAVLFFADRVARSVEIRIFIENAVARVTAVRRVVGRRGRHAGRGSGRTAAEALVVPVIFAVLSPVRIQDAASLRIRRHGRLRFLRAARLLRPAILTHLTPALKAEVLAEFVKTLGTVDVVFRIRLRHILLRILLLRPVILPGIRRLRIRILLRRLGVIQIVQPGRIRRRGVDRAGIFRLPARFAARRKAAPADGVDQIRAAGYEQRKDDVPAYRRRQLCDGIDDQPENGAARGRCRPGIPLPSARTRGITVGKIAAVAVVRDTDRRGRYRMDKAYEKHEEQDTKPDDLAGDGGFFARDEHDPRKNKRGKHHIRAVTERAEQKRADGKADIAEHHVARDEDDERDRGEEHQNDARRFARENAVFVSLIIFASSSQVIQDPSPFRNGTSLFLTLFSLYHFSAYNSIKKREEFEIYRARIIKGLPPYAGALRLSGKIYISSFSPLQEYILRSSSPTSSS